DSCSDHYPPHTAISTLSLHDALPIWESEAPPDSGFDSLRVREQKENNLFRTPMTSSSFASPERFPEAAAPLEEACAPLPRDMGAAVAFALSRRPAADERPVLLALPRSWVGEYGRPYAPGLTGPAPLLVRASTTAEVLWALEQGLRSGAVSLALGAAGDATLAQSRRLEFAARHGGAVGVTLSRRLDGLSA